mgnify:CR=1 FL=1
MPKGIYKHTDRQGFKRGHNLKQIMQKGVY